MALKSLKTNVEELAKIPIGVVAEIAAALSNSTASPCDAVEHAYRLLDVAATARGELEEGNSYEEGIQKHRELETWWEGYQRNRDSLQNLILKDDRGNPTPVPFELGLSKLMGRIQKTKRQTLFRKWIMGAEEIKAPDGSQYKTEEAHKKIAQWKKSGIPCDIFELARGGFEAWHKSDISKKRSVSGKKSASMQKQANNRK